MMPQILELSIWRYSFQVLLVLSCPHVFGQQTIDWLIDDGTFVAEVSKTEEYLSLSNGLVSRTIRLSPNAATVAFENLMTKSTIIRGVKPEARIRIDDVDYNIGGLQGQPNYAFLKEDWIDQMTFDSSAFRLVSVSTGIPTAHMQWKQVRAHAVSAGSWPPEGVSARLDFRAGASSRLDLSGITVSVHYELYDGIPVLCKWLTIQNDGNHTVEIDDFTSEILATVEYGSSVDSRSTSVPLANIHVETDYAFGSMEADDANQHAVHWLPDTQYHTQVNYLKNNRCLLEVSPTIGPDYVLEPGGKFESFRTIILPYDSYERERQGLARRRMYRKLAPWTTENPLMMHVRYADWESVRLAIDQAAETGFEMIILTFGSGFNIEDESPEYLSKMREYADYAKSKGLEIGGYSLLASRSIDGENDVVMPDGQKPTFNKSPCIGSKWGQEYFDKLYRFYEKTGFALLEHDGSYPGDICISTDHPGHRGYEDSRWNQYAVISDFYKWCRANGIYLNIPDYYYMTGGNKCAMGYRETNWSLPREQQVIHTRHNIFDGTWNKLSTMGWMFVPLTEYHGGGDAATIEPLNEHLDHYQKMMVSNLGAGVQACYRGPRLYDTEETKRMVQNMVSWYKKHREVLEGDLIHLKRADGRTLDYWLMVNPDGKEKGALMVFNPTNGDLKSTIQVPLYYTGLSNEVVIRKDDQTMSQRLDRNFEIGIEVTVAAQGYSVYFFE